LLVGIAVTTETAVATVAASPFPSLHPTLHHNNATSKQPNATQTAG